MTIRARNRAIAVGAIVATVGLLLTILPMLAANDLDGRRRVHLVVRDMSYYLDGKGEPNPTLQFRRGERIRLILTNEDAGMDHDFVVENWNLATKVLHGRGQEAVSFKVPGGAGSATYFCTPHSAKMRGGILIE